MSQINFNSRVTLDELRTLIPTIGKDLTVLVQSEPGCGKSSLLKMIEQDHGDAYDYIYVDCPAKDLGDIGLTIPDKDTKRLEFYVAELFKLDSDKPKVIMLDEFMKSPKLLQIIFTRLMLERMVGDAPLPDGSIVFATSNNASDGVGDSMLAHAANRVCIVEMQKPDARAWLKYATERGISRIIRSWVELNPRCLASYRDGEQQDNPYIFNPSKPVLSFCSPRSLEKANAIVINRDVLGENATIAALSGTIGASAAKDMATLMSLDKALPDVKKDICANPETIAVPEQIAAQVMIMLQAVDVLETQDELSKFMKFIDRIPSAEIQAIFFTLMMRVTKAVRLAKNNKAICDWARNNNEMFG